MFPKLADYSAALFFLLKVIAKHDVTKLFQFETFPGNDASHIY
jgi:hypothetical protein